MRSIQSSLHAVNFSCGPIFPADKSCMRARRGTGREVSCSSLPGCADLGPGPASPAAITKNQGHGATSPLSQRARAAHFGPRTLRTGIPQASPAVGCRCRRPRPKSLLKIMDRHAVRTCVELFPSLQTCPLHSLSCGRWRGPATPTIDGAIGRHRQKLCLGTRDVLAICGTSQ